MKTTNKINAVHRSRLWFNGAFRSSAVAE